MSRIEKAFETRFRQLLGMLQARRLDQGVAWLVDQARHRMRQEGLSRAEALVEVEERLHRTIRRRPRRGVPSHPAPLRLPSSPEASRLFLCDAGLGALARWLRAAGYDALWVPDIDDAVLLQKAEQHAACLLTTDSLLMERRLLRDGVIPAVWLPSTLTPEEQLRLVFRSLHLELRPGRCMKCGGELVPVDKQSVWDQIPPRTRLWLDDYFVCNRCRQLFWHGTHWKRIRARLSGICAAPD